MSEIRIENDVVIGNVCNKYASSNPVMRLLMGNFLSTLDKLVSQIAPNTIHEVGCGEGELITRYSRDGATLMGSDFSTKLIDQAREKYRDTNVNFFPASIYDLNQNHQAELILCCEVLEHLVDPFKAVEKLSELARPHLIASVPNEPIWRILNMARGAYWKNWGNTPGHLHHWSRDSFVSLLSKEFDIVNVSNPFPWTMVLCKAK